MVKYKKDKKGRTYIEIGALDYSDSCPVCGSKTHTICNFGIKKRK